MGSKRSVPLRPALPLTLTLTLSLLLLLGCPASRVAEDGFPTDIDEASAERLRRAVLAALPAASPPDLTGTPIPDLALLQAHPGVALALGEFATGYESPASTQLAWLQFWSERQQDPDLSEDELDASPIVALVLPPADARQLSTLVMAHKPEIFRFGLLDQPDPLALALLFRDDATTLIDLLRTADPEHDELQAKSADAAIAYLTATSDLASSLPVALRPLREQFSDQARIDIAADWAGWVTDRVHRVALAFEGQAYEDRPAFAYGQPTRASSARAMRALFAAIAVNSRKEAQQDPQIVNTAVLWLQGMTLHLGRGKVTYDDATAVADTVEALFDAQALAALPPSEAQRLTAALRSLRDALSNDKVTPTAGEERAG